MRRFKALSNRFVVHDMVFNVQQFINHHNYSQIIINNYKEYERYNRSYER